MTIIDSFSEIFDNKNRILVILAHPDDAEIYCGATISKLTSLGKTVRVVKMTSGNRGNKQQDISATELEKTRLEEDRAAMKIMGIKDDDNVYLGLGDGTVDNSLETIEKVAYQIREFKPDIIITHNPEDMIIRYAKNESWVNHRDHRNTGQSVIDAAYPYSRDTLFFPEQLKNPKLSSHCVSQFLLVDYYHHPDTVSVEVTNYFSKNSDDPRRFERFRYVITD